MLSRLRWKARRIAMSPRDQREQHDAMIAPAGMPEQSCDLDSLAHSSLRRGIFREGAAGSR